MPQENAQERRTEELVAPLRAAYRDLPPVDDLFGALLAKFDQKAKEPR